MNFDLRYPRISAISAERKEKRSSKFLIGLIGFPAIFDRWKFFSNFKFPSRFYQISIRIFPLSFKFTKVSDFFSKSSCVSDFGSKLEYVRWIDVYLFIYFCFLILFCENVTLSGLLFLQVIWFSRIKSASQMSRLIFNYSCSVQLFSCSIRFYIRIYSRIRWFPGDFNERLYLANDQFGFSTILQFASWILLFLVDIKCNFEFYKQFYYLFTHIEECSLL